MGIFNRRGGERAGRNQESANDKTGWENMDVPYQGGRQVEQQKTAEQLSAERQQRKIIAAFALGRDGHVSNEPFKQHDVAVDNDVRDSILEMMARGDITAAQEDELIDGIKGPLQQSGYDTVLQRLGTRQEKRILTSMSESGFDNWQNAGKNDLSTFIRMYPSPRSFEDQSQRFLEMIRTNNSDEKYRQYLGAMEDFKHKVYGKKQEYWDQIKALHAEADEKILSQDTEWKQAARAERPVNDYGDFQQRRPEVERNYEWQPGEVGYWQTSRMQARAGEVTRENIDHGLWADRSCEDSMFVRPDQNMYGVFDGAGGHQGGRLASELTASVVREFSDRYALDSGSSLAYVLNVANERVTNNPNAGLSTAVLAKAINRNGRMMLAYASVGDSRIYIVDKDGKATQITRDEGEGRYIYNAIGQEAKLGESRTQQFGEVDLRKGDRVVLCSDGVTGDYGDDLMSDRELGFLVAHSRGAQEASKNLLANARKFDDRTAIVFGEY